MKCQPPEHGGGRSTRVQLRSRRAMEGGFSWSPCCCCCCFVLDCVILFSPASISFLTTKQYGHMSMQIFPFRKFTTSSKSSVMSQMAPVGPASLHHIFSNPLRCSDVILHGEAEAVTWRNQEKETFPRGRRRGASVNESGSDLIGL